MSLFLDDLPKTEKCNALLTLEFKGISNHQRIKVYDEMNIAEGWVKHDSVETAFYKTYQPRAIMTDAEKSDDLKEGLIIILKKIEQLKFDSLAVIAQVGNSTPLIFKIHPTDLI